MATLSERGPALADALAARTREIAASLRGLDERGLGTPSQLDGWSRLTIACHLRYGAEALTRMTLDTRADKVTSYYPGGRADERLGTLSPRAGETPFDVVEGFVAESENLQRAWASATRAEWNLTVREPAENPDLGSVPLTRLPLARLTEVEVHGSDLGLGLKDWSDVFVEMALPSRLEWLNTRRTNHRDVDESLQGSWLLMATDGPTWLISVTGSSVQALPVSGSSAATSVVQGSSRDLLALLLGRPTNSELLIGGDVRFGESFQSAFPGP